MLEEPQATSTCEAGENPGHQAEAPAEGTAEAPAEGTAEAPAEAPAEGTTATRTGARFERRPDAGNHKVLAIVSTIDYTS